MATLPFHLVELVEDAQQVVVLRLPVELVHAAVTDQRGKHVAEVIACSRRSTPSAVASGHCVTQVHVSHRIAINCHQTVAHRFELRAGIKSVVFSAGMQLATDCQPI